MISAATALETPCSRLATVAQARRAPLPPRRRHHLLPAAAAAADAEQQHQQQPQTSTSRRGLLTAGGLLLAGAATGAPPAACADDAGSGTAVEGEGLVPYANPAQAYTLLRPAGWEQVGKAGADALFRDPSRKSTTVGVTVYPVMIDGLAAFGDLEAVGERLLAAERGKESTLEVAMVAQRQRGPYYDFEYELDSTRGRKRVFSTVTIAARKLYISNGQVSCGKGAACEGEAAAALPLVRRVTQSLAAGAPQ